MDLFNLFSLIGGSILIGIIVTLVVQYYVLVRYFNKAPVVPDSSKRANKATPFVLPEALKLKLAEEKEPDDNSSLPVSLMLQFLFHELRHSDNIKRWLYKKLSMEFDELLTKTTIGKFFEAVTIRDMDLGTQFPDIKDISLDSIKMDKTEGYIDTLNLSVKLDYTGNFSLSVDAKMKFGRTAYLSIKVKQVSGTARLQFTRTPYTHWSFSFYEEPVMELGVESHFQGRQLQSNITNLIVNQIKKAIKRKHTLPNYKIRYKPFFVKTDPGMDSDETEIIPQGQLEVSCLQVSRLAVTPDISSIYCTFTIDCVPFISVYQKENALVLMLELIVTKLRQQTLGVIFKQELNSVVVESVTPGTSAALAGLKTGDTVVSIENKNVTNVSQIAKIIKSVSSINISFKIERNTSGYVFRSSTLCDPPKITIDEDPEPESYVIVEKPEKKTPKMMSTNFAQTIGNLASLRKRKNSTDSSRSTPTPSCPGTPQHFRSNLTLQKKHSISEVPEIIQTDPENQEIELLNLTEIHKSKETCNNPLIVLSDEFNFSLKDNNKFLNVNVWGMCQNKNSVLLGYTNISLTEILNACCNSMLGHYTRSYSFLPPNNAPVTSQTHPLFSHSGFEHVFCYGDVLLSFVWHHENPEIRRKDSNVVTDVEVKELKHVKRAQHDFVRTQFHRSIHCDFCSKKIWLKDAVQCRDCGLCCHKKCIAKCQTSTECNQKTSEDPVQIEMNDNSSFEDETGGENVIKRVNSANNLSIPGAHVQTNQSRSLPQSPQRTPNRKHSLVQTTSPFTLCLLALEEIHSSIQDPTEWINRLLEQITLSGSDENLMEMARESGRVMYINLPQEEKTDKINAMMTELKKQFDHVTTDHSELTKRLAGEELEVEKAKIAFLLGQADSKINGLSVLMLHYCSGMQQGS